MTFRQKIMTRTRSQDIKNDNLNVPSTKGTTVEPASRPTVVTVGTLTEGLWGSGGCCHAPDDNVKSGTDVDMRSIVNILSFGSRKSSQKTVCTNCRFNKARFASGCRGSSRHRELGSLAHHLCRSCQINSTDPKWH